MATIISDNLVNDKNYLENILIELRESWRTNLKLQFIFQNNYSNSKMVISVNYLCKEYLILLGKKILDLLDFLRANNCSVKIIPIPPCFFEKYRLPELVNDWSVQVVAPQYISTICGEFNFYGARLSDEENDKLEIFLTCKDCRIRKSTSLCGGIYRSKFCVYELDGGLRHWIVDNKKYFQGNILEVGCGSVAMFDFYLNAMQEGKVKKVYLVDPSLKQFMDNDIYLRNKLDQNKDLFKTQSTKIQEWDFPNTDYFDTFILIYSFGHLPEPRDIFSKIRRWLKKPGFVLITEFDPEMELNKKSTVYHDNILGRDDIIRLFGKIGFDMVKSEYNNGKMNLVFQKC